MRTIPTISASLVIACSALAGIAQAQPAARAPPRAAASMPHECAQPMVKHSHAGDKGEPGEGCEVRPVRSAHLRSPQERQEEARSRARRQVTEPNRLEGKRAQRKANAS